MLNSLTPRSKGSLLLELEDEALFQVESAERRKRKSRLSGSASFGQPAICGNALECPLPSRSIRDYLPERLARAYEEHVLPDGRLYAWQAEAICTPGVLQVCWERVAGTVDRMHVESSECMSAVGL